MNIVALWLEFIVEAAPLEGRAVESSVTHESSVSNSEKMDCTQRWSLLDRGKVVNDVMKLRKVTDATSLSAAIMDPSKFSSTVSLPRTAPEGPSPVVHHQSSFIAWHYSIYTYIRVTRWSNKSYSKGIYACYISC